MESKRSMVVGELSVLKGFCFAIVIWTLSLEYFSLKMLYRPLSFICYIARSLKMGAPVLLCLTRHFINKELQHEKIERYGEFN